MPYAVLEKDIERLDETQQNAVVLSVRFLWQSIMPFKQEQDYT